MTDYLVIGQAEIDEMRQRIAADRWIPVGEWLPEPDDYVLIYADETIMVGYRWDSGEFWSEAREGMMVPVTHWQPLPPPPPQENA